MKEISPQHGENGRKSAILGVRGRIMFHSWCWIRRQGRRMFQPGCLWPRWCSGCRRTRPLCVPVGGGPPASRPRRELRSARRLVVRPGPAGLAAASNRSGCLCVARPGPAVVSAMLHVIRLRLFQTMNPRRWNFNVSGLLLRVGAIELRATFPGVVSAVTPRSLWRPSCRCGLVCCCVCWPRIQLVFGTKFALLGLLVAKTVESSPCTRKTRQKEPFRASRANFIPHMR